MNECSSCRYWIENNAEQLCQFGHCYLVHTKPIEKERTDWCLSFSPIDSEGKVLE